MRALSGSPPPLDDLRLFAAVAEARSFTSAARELGVPLATLSRRIALLERRLGATLLKRSTRRVEPTDAGMLLAERAMPALVDLQGALDCLGEDTARPRGRLKITMPADLARECFAVPLAAFSARHPDIRLDLQLTARVVDLIGDRVDLAIRVGVPADSSMIARPLAELAHALYASPAYLASMAAPVRPADLVDFNALVLSGRRIDLEWRLTRGRSESRVRPSGNLQVDDMGALIEFTAAGSGVALLPTGFVRSLLEARQLVRVLPEWYRTRYAVARHLYRQAHAGAAAPAPGSPAGLDRPQSTRLKFRIC